MTRAVLSLIGRCGCGALRDAGLYERGPAGASILEEDDGVRREAVKLKAGDHISLVRVQAEEEFGSFVSSGVDDFTFYDVDLKRTVTLRYDEVKKLKEGMPGTTSRRIGIRIESGQLWSWRCRLGL